MKRAKPGTLYGLLAEFETPTEVVKAARAAHADGYRRMEAYSPFPVEGLSEAVGFPKDRVPAVCLVGGLLGLLTAYSLQYWINVISYPIDVAGRPFHSWPSFIVVSFELTILFGGISAVVGMLAMNGLPMPYHPLFAVKEFSQVSRDRFFLCIEAADPRFDPQKTREFLGGLKPREVVEVPN
jgi:Alternative complex III, ActD subunit